MKGRCGLEEIIGGCFMRLLLHPGQEQLDIRDALAQARSAGRILTLLELLRDQGWPLPAPCGGRGTCGKCRVEIAGIGSRLACRTVVDEQLWQQAGCPVDQPLQITLPVSRQAQISTDGLLNHPTLNPLIARTTVSLPPADLHDARPFDQRLADLTGLEASLDSLHHLPDGWPEMAVDLMIDYRQDQKKILSCGRLEAASAPVTGLAVDIGTTTIGAWLYDLASGARLASGAMLNPQQSYGADVISRIDQAADPIMARTMQQQVTEAIDSLAADLLRQSGLTPAGAAAASPLGYVVIAGNTTMLHLLLGLPPASLARTPFVPVSLARQRLRPQDLGLNLPTACVVEILPGIASYVGADLTAGSLACDLDLAGSEGGIRLLLDIGTNGEIVLATPEGMTACSTAAGPAFEGANISCGMSGVAGAIDRVDWQDDQLWLRMIAPTADPDTRSDRSARRPLGLCGSGLIAAIAVCLETGLIDETGRICDEPDSLPPSLQSYLGELDGKPAIILVPADPADGSLPVALTQKDIREVQNAKAALAAGITVLLERSGLRADQVDQLYLAGGFGQYLDPEHAFRIGLLPDALRGRTLAVGNSAGMGAIRVLLDQAQSERAVRLARQIRYIELSADPRFTELYVDAMFFPEDDS